MNCLNMENPENPQEWYGVNEHRFCTVLEVKDGKIIWPFFITGNTFGCNRL